MSKDLKVVGITKKLLVEGIHQNIYWKDKLPPMPKEKAKWLLSNDRIADDDYCGVIAFEGEKMISFIYLIPDLLNSNTQEFKKVYWMISWWVHPKYEGTVLATYVYNESMTLTGKQILIKSFAEDATQFYSKQPYRTIASRLRYTLFFSADSSMLIGKFRFLKSFKFILDGIDSIVYSIFKKKNILKNKKKTQGLVYKYMNQIDEKTWQFIEPLCKEDLIYKTKAYVNWQLDNSQYLQTPVATKFPFKPLGTGNSNNIHIHNLKIIKDTEIIGFLSFVLNYNEFNVKYFLVQDEQYYNLCIDAIMENFNNTGAKFMFTDDTKLAEAIKKRYSTVFTHKVNKKALAHNEIKSNIENFSLFNRDGHFY